MDNFNFTHSSILRESSKRRLKVLYTVINKIKLYKFLLIRRRNTHLSIYKKVCERVSK